MEFYILGEFPNKPVEKLVVIDNDDFGEKSYRKYSPNDENIPDLKIVKASKFTKFLNVRKALRSSDQNIMKLSDYPALLFDSVETIMVNSKILFTNGVEVPSSSLLCIVYQESIFIAISISYSFIFRGYFRPACRP